MHLPDLVQNNTSSHANSTTTTTTGRITKKTAKTFHMDTDPRVQVELENLNTSTEFINKLELELEKARNEFNKLVCDSTQKIEALSKKLGSSITKARPYYEARITAAELHNQAQNEAQRFEQAIDAQHKAKELVHQAEQNLNTPECDTKLSEELLTLSANTVNRSELQRLAAQRQHEITSQAYNHTEQRLSKLHKQLKRSIIKSSLETRRNFLDLNNYVNQHQLQLLPYFEMKAQFNQMLDEQINKIRSYETRVNKAKLNYTKALQRLEELNQKIYNSIDQFPEDEYIPIAERPNTNNLDNSTSSILVMDDVKLDSSEAEEVEPTSSKIFDNKLLDQLILDDNIDSTLEKLKNQSLT
ncbi:hypothetical protein RDWZM_004388 [Blomia tropicalis]|uniref:SH3 domain-binding protein 5-like n=1 Tax=Blomia tropicalis TaxID=40697 RepID=A0A9Q0MH12_BLOTA|nr:SH3 domain-binding protein 5-like [Blomia tropicalis]KAJ6225843.1 hypothetical protein RDWZM_004388 [Blomia tropicalis]